MEVISFSSGRPRDVLSVLRWGHFGDLENNWEYRNNVTSVVSLLQLEPAPNFSARPGHNQARPGPVNGFETLTKRQKMNLIRTPFVLHLSKQRSGPPWFHSGHCHPNKLMLLNLKDVVWLGPAENHARELAWFPSQLECSVTWREFTAELEIGGIWCFWSNYSSFFKYCHFRPPKFGPRNYQTAVVFVLSELNSVIELIIVRDFSVIFDSK